MYLLILATFIGLLFILLHQSKHDQKTLKRKLSKWAISEKLPWELRDATLFLNEKDIATYSPVPLHGRPDQVLKLIDGSLVILDTKTRDYIFVHMSDIIQISVYALILSSKGYKVRPYAYIRLVVRDTDKRSVKYLKVRLLSEKKVVNLWQHYWAIVDGEVKPDCTGKLCQTTKSVATGK